MTTPEVIAREPAYWNGFGKSYTEQERPLPNVDKLLMSDDSIAYGCTLCDYTNVSAKSVQTHQTKHSTKGIGTYRYGPDVIAKVLKLRELERAQGVRGWPERVAARLNKANVPTLSGEPWLAADVQSLSRHYNAANTDVLVTVSRTPEHDPMAALPAMTNRERAIKIATNLMQARKLLAEIADMEAIFNGCDHDDYDEFKAKARKWDELKSLMGEEK